jgi:hypothetical protein
MNFENKSSKADLKKKKTLEIVTFLYMSSKVWYPKLCKDVFLFFSYFFNRKIQLNRLMNTMVKTKTPQNFKKIASKYYKYPVITLNQGLWGPKLMFFGLWCGCPFTLALDF